MKVSLSLLTTCGFLSLANAAQRRWDNSTVVTTVIVSSYTTVCPTPTEVTVNNQTYTVTSSTTLTITNCPCTITSSYTPPATPVAPPAGSATSPPPAPTVTAPVAFTGGAAALGSSFGALVIGYAVAMFL